MSIKENVAQSWQEPDLVDSWKVTFTDLLTLLVTLFVMLISMSTLRQGVVDGGPNPEWTVNGNSYAVTPGAVQGRADRAESAAGIGEIGARMAQLRLGLARAGLAAGYELSFDRRGIALEFSLPLLAGSRLGRDGRTLLGGLAAYLSQSGQAVEVVAVAGTTRAGSWRTAASEAERVATLLNEVGAPASQVVPVARALPFIEPVEGEGADGAGRVLFLFAN